MRADIDNSDSLQSIVGARGLSEYFPGNCPIIISAPHGGLEMPLDIPDRTHGCLVSDLFSLELATEIANALSRMLPAGVRPHLIVSKLKRRKMDANRNKQDAAHGDPIAEQVWEDYHGFIEEAIRRSVSDFGFAQGFDVHGQQHRGATELGYLLNGAMLSNSDEGISSNEG